MSGAALAAYMRSRNPTLTNVAFLFPGQGAQRVGMGKSLYETFASARGAYDEASTLLSFDVASLCFDGPEETLRETENAQVALYVTSVAALRSFLEICPLVPFAVAGHSVGEYAALVAAGAMDFAEGVRLVRTRGELMRDAAKKMPGGMAAVIGLEAEAAREVCDEARAAGTGIVSIANYNGGGQIVISGEKAAVEQASVIAKAKGAKRVLPLAVSGGFHSPLMVTAGDALFAHLSRATFRKPSVKIVANYTAEYITVPADVTGGLTMQVSGSVRWEESMQLLLRDGVDTFLEFGVGDTLCNLLKRIDPATKRASVHDAESVQAACALLEQGSSV